MSDIATRLGASVSKEFLKIITEYDRGLPIAAAHVVRDKAMTRVYWVSGGSLVTLDYRLETQEGVQTALATGRVRSLASARVDIEAVIKAGGQVEAVGRTVRLHFDGEEQPVILPDRLAGPQPLDDAIPRERVTKFLDALLRALDAHPPANG
jgi:hypothetical protein